jgi:hypothetical protein
MLPSSRLVESGGSLSLLDGIWERLSTLKARGTAMHREIETRLDQLRQLCEKHRVACLDLFGSATWDDFDPERRMTLWSEVPQDSTSSDSPC